MQLCYNGTIVSTINIYHFILLLKMMFPSLTTQRLDTENHKVKKKWQQSVTW